MEKQMEILINNNRKLAPLPEEFNEESYREIGRFHRGLEGYSKTPLVALGALAKKLGVRGIYMKDESHRFGLNAFKALGASWAVNRLMREDGDGKKVFVTATDGNHGRAVAWAAARAGAGAVVFMPKGSVESRVKAIEALGAKVTVTDFGYDSTVAAAAEYAKSNNYILIQDTSFEGYTKIPMDITLGYSTMAAEALEQLGSLRPTHVILQAGVGSMAAGVMGYLKDALGYDNIKVIVAEAMAADCIYQSALRGERTGVPDGFTIMAGLNCGSVSLCVYELIMNNTFAFVRCADSVTEEGMRLLAHPEGGDERIISGESGAVGAGILSLMSKNDDYKAFREDLGINEESVILLFSTEGATDPDNYRAVVGDGVL